MAAQSPVPDLLDELVEEILLRIPPHDPARLFRAALVCKRWCRIVSDPGFRRRFRERHRRAPELGIVRNFFKKGHLTTTQFVPTCSFRPRSADADDRRGWQAIDSRHGRVLLHRVRHDYSDFDGVLDVWDPVADERRELPLFPCEDLDDWKASVLCAAADGECDHRDCHRGPFLVVVVGRQPGQLCSFVYSSESDSWSESTSTLHDEIDFSEGLRGAHVGNALYYRFHGGSNLGILEYDLATRGMSMINLPPDSWKGYTLLMAAEGGGLGCAVVNEDGSLLHLWSRKPGPGGHMGWTQSKVIQLKMLIPPGCDMFKLRPCIPCLIKLDVVGFPDGDVVLYMGTNRGYYCADLKSGRLRKLRGISGTDDIVPFMSFCTPALGVSSTRNGDSKACHERSETAV